MLEMVNPETIIPAHAGHDKAIHIKNLSDNINIGKTILTQNGNHIKSFDDIIISFIKL